jgi:hypothetical protein
VNAKYSTVNITGLARDRGQIYVEMSRYEIDGSMVSEQLDNEVDRLISWI